MGQHQLGCEHMREEVLWNPLEFSANENLQIENWISTEKIAHARRIINKITANVATVHICVSVKCHGDHKTVIKLR